MRGQWDNIWYYNIRSYTELFVSNNTIDKSSDISKGLGPQRLVEQIGMICAASVGQILYNISFLPM